MKLALYKAAEGTLLDKVIDVGTGLYGYSHNEIVFDRIMSDDNERRSFCFSSSPREGEARFKWIDLNSGKWQVIDLNNTYTISDEESAFIEAKTIEGSKYDYYGIFMTYILFWVKKQKNDRWWCSEVGAKLLGWTKFRVTPNKLARFYKSQRGEFKFSFIWKKTY